MTRSAKSAESKTADDGSLLATAGGFTSSQLLRPIPEDRSATSATPKAGRRRGRGRDEAASEAATSTRTLRNGHEESVLSDASAVIAGSVQDQQQQDVSVRPRRMSRRESIRVMATSRRAMVLALLMLLVAAIATIAAVFANRNDDDDTTGDRNITVEITGPPTPPTLAPVSDASLDLDSILIELSDPNALFDDEETAAYQARQWMLHEDEFLHESLEVAESTGDEGAVIQRYSLVVLYFACNGPYWNQTTTDQDSVAFLTPTASECDWIGVDCGDQGQVNVLDLQRSNVTCPVSLPAELQYLTGMRELLLNQNQIAGSLFLPDPESTTVSSSSPSWLGSMPLLSYLDLSLNLLTGPIPDDLWTRIALRFVYLHDNFFGGSLPVDRPLATSTDDDSFTTSTTLTFLEDIWVSNNRLTGPAPSWMLEQLESLQTIQIDINGFTGFLPTFVAAPNVTYVDFSNNFVAGNLAQSFFETATLEYLYLDNNTLSGKLPRGDHESLLKHVWLNENNFDGLIPSMFGFFWTQLDELRLQDNDLTGSLEGQCQNASWPLDPVVIADCASNNGGAVEVTCSCCECPPPEN